MRTFFLTVVICVFCLSYSFAQEEATGQSLENYSHEFGKVTNYEMTVTQFPGDPDAEAFYIYELGDYSFQGDYTDGFLLRQQIQCKIKILSQAGLDYATFEIPLYVSSTQVEKVELLKGSTYNVVDGKLVRSELEMKNVFEEKISPNWILKKFAMPDVKEGSVIEVKYTIVTPFLFEMRPWYFQHRIPVKYSLLKCRLIPYYEYAFILRGTNGFDIYDQYDHSNEIQFRNLRYREREVKYGLEDVPAFRDEEYISSMNDYRIGIQFQLATLYYPHGGKKEILSTWPTLRQEFMKSDEFGKYVNTARKEGKKIIKQLGLDEKTDIEKVKGITQYVKMLYNWNGNTGKYASQKVPEFLKNKTGNVADINLFLTALLQSAGLDAHPVVLSTRANGLLYKSYPFASMLNYVVAMVNVDGTEYHLDATESLYYFDRLPTRCIHVDGLVVNTEKEDTWTYLEDKYLTLITHTMTLQIDPGENSATVKVNIEADGHSGVRFRSRKLAGEEKLTEYLQKRFELDRINNLQTGSIEEIDKPFNLSFTYETSVEGTSDKLFISPFAGLTLKDNPFKQNKRLLPVDVLYVSEERFISEIEIPEGYKIASVPQNRISASPVLDISYEVLPEEKKIIVKGGFAFKQSFFLPQYYDTLKHRMAAILGRLSDRIVLEKEL